MILQEKSWRRGWDLNPRMEVLQTSPLGLLGTAPGRIQYSQIPTGCQCGENITRTAGEARSQSSLRG